MRESEWCLQVAARGEANHKIALTLALSRKAGEGKCGGRKLSARPCLRHRAPSPRRDSSARTGFSIFLQIADDDPGQRIGLDDLVRRGLHGRVGLRFDARLQRLHVVVRAVVERRCRSSRRARRPSVSYSPGMLRTSPTLIFAISSRGQRLRRRSRPSIRAGARPRIRRSCRSAPAHTAGTAAGRAHRSRKLKAP